MSNSWIPVSSGRYPASEKLVQITFRNYSNPAELCCSAFAYVYDVKEEEFPVCWYLEDGIEVSGRVVAWRYNDDAYDPSSRHDSDRYNSAVRRCIADEYVRTSKDLQIAKLEYSNVCEQLHDKSISHSDYVDKEKYLRVLDDKIRRLEVELNTWDAAREICLNVADGVGDN